MDHADRIIDQLCREYDVSPDFGNRLKPLILRAQKSSPEAKERIMDLVKRSFAHEAARAREERGDLPEPDEWRVLNTVAEILHSWNPPGWLDPDASPG